MGLFMPAIAQDKGEIKFISDYADTWMPKTAFWLYPS